MEDKNKLKKKLVASTTAASMLIGGAFSPPADLPDNPRDRMTPPAIIEMVVPDIVDDDDGDDSVILPEEEKKRKGVRQRLLVAVPLVIAFWVGGIVLASLGMSLLNPVLGKVLDWFISTVLLLLTYTVVAKVMFPELKIKQILNWKAILAVIAGATVVSLILKGIAIFK